MFDEFEVRDSYDRAMVTIVLHVVRQRSGVETLREAAKIIGRAVKRHEVIDGGDLDRALNDYKL